MALHHHTPKQKKAIRAKSAKAVKAKSTKRK